MLHARWTVLPAIAGMATLLAGCSLAASVTGASTPTPTLTVLSAEQAAEVFADSICPFNSGVSEFNTTWDNLDAPLRDVQEAAALNRTEAQAAKEKLQSAAWPDDVAADVAIVVDYFATRIAELDVVLEAGTVDEVNVIDLTTPPNVTEAADRVEEALGLGQDYCPGAATPEPEPAAGLYAGDLVGTSWMGVDNDGYAVELEFRGDGTAAYAVGSMTFEAGSVDVVDDAFSFFATADTGEIIDVLGSYDAADSVTIEGTVRESGATWTAELLPSPW